MITTLTGKNQVTVPAEIARELGLVPGSRLEWSIGDAPSTIVIGIKPSKSQLLARAQKIGDTFKKRDLIADLVQNRSSED